MNIQKFLISNDSKLYEAWPDVVLTEDGKLVAVFSECIHHKDRSYTRIMLTESSDRGRNWTPKHPLTEGTQNLPYMYNCARITKIADGRLVITLDRVKHGCEDDPDKSKVLLFFSSDNGKTWEKPIETPLRGIVPDRLIELDNGRWIISAHYRENGDLTQFMRYSDDQGKSWSEPIIVAKASGLELCEVCMLPLGNGKIAAFLRENSLKGYDCKKVLSYDNGETWSEIINFPICGCHRPTAGLLKNGQVFITYRFMQGGGGEIWERAQNFMGYLTDLKSVEAKTREGASGRVIPIDYDRSPFADLGYSGWVEFDDGEIYIVSYIVDDAYDKGQIRGYSMQLSDLVF
ncbi:MAG: exo-alpha-sialidase [Lentisphaeria bacterium]|nr:exo-alpha-sialidase [Lentisphaeria bacterium]